MRDAARRRSTPTCSAGSAPATRPTSRTCCARLPALGRRAPLRGGHAPPRARPDGVEPIELPARSQELRMAWSVPRLLRRLRPALAHFQHALPLALPVPGRRHRPRPLVRARAGARWAASTGASSGASCPRSARRARRVIAVSERTKRDLVELYGVPAERIVVTPHGVDPAFGPGERAGGGYLLFVGAIQERKDPLAAADAAARGRAAARRRRAGEGAARSPASSSARGADLRGYVEKAELADALPRRRRASCCRRATRASACRCSRRWRAGRRSSPPTSRRCARSPATPRSSPSGDLADAIRRGARRPRPARRRRARAGEGGSPGTRPRGGRSTSTARCSGDDDLGGRRLARPRAPSSASPLPALAPQVDEIVVIANIPGSVAGGARRRARDRERAAALASPPT